MTATDAPAPTPHALEDSRGTPLKVPASPARARSNVHPIRLRVRDDKTTLTISRIVAYQPRCSCDWEGDCWQTWREANGERRFHAGGHAG